MDYYAIGQRIRSKRKERGLSQEALAEAVGISVTHMSHIETGSTKLSLPVLAALSDALDVRADVLLHEREGTAERDAMIEDVVRLLSGCTKAQMEVLTEVLRATKSSLERFF